MVGSCYVNLDGIIMCPGGRLHRGHLPFVEAGFSSFTEVYSGMILPNAQQRPGSRLVARLAISEPSERSDYSGAPRNSEKHFQN